MSEANDDNLVRSEQPKNPSPPVNDSSGRTSSVNSNDNRAGSDRNIDNRAGSNRN